MLGTNVGFIEQLLHSTHCVGITCSTMQLCV